jgi:hypothetical protein
MAQSVHETTLGRIEIVDQPEEPTQTTNQKNTTLPLAILVSALTILFALALFKRTRKN